MKSPRMKSLAFLLAVTMTLSLFSALAFAGGHPSATYTIFAAQNIPVGNLLVSHSDGELTVTYSMTGNWRLTETHLHVSSTLAGIPRAGRTLNPAPGQFEHKETHALVQTYTYTIPWTATGQVFIAAHAAVSEVSLVTGTLEPTLTWRRSSEVPQLVQQFPGRGAQWTPTQGFAIPLTDTVVWDGGAITQFGSGPITPGVRYATWNYSNPLAGNFNNVTDLRRFQATFNIPTGFTITGGNLGSVNPGYENMVPINDNIYVFVNEDLLFWGGTILDPSIAPGTMFLGTSGHAAQGHNPRTGPAETDGWFIPGTIPTIGAASFVVGQNELDIFAEEFQTWGAMHELKLTLEYEAVETVLRTESAWAATAVGMTRLNPQGNWATFVIFPVPDPD